jgi:hypothetical protein
LDQKKLAEILRLGNVEWRKYVLQRLAERSISQNAVTNVLTSGEKIEDHPKDKPYPSALFLGWIEDKPLHVLVAMEEKSEKAYIITAYEPNLEYFEPDFKVRRKRS